MVADLTGRVAIVTGGARGFGKEIVARLKRDGAVVSAWDISPDPTQVVDDVRSVDITVSGSVDEAFAETVAKLGHVDILINNAGVNGPTQPCWTYDDANWHRVMSVDLHGVFYCCRAAIPHMLTRKYGRIVNIASIAGKEGNANAAPYSAAKAGVIALTKSLGKELATEGILVNCITPAMADTDLIKEATPEYIEAIKAKIPMGRLCNVDEVAEMVAWLSGPSVSFTTGAAFDLSGGRAVY